MESNISAPQAIGKRIALLRQEKGLTQTELGNMIHQRREVVSYWENGSRDIKSGDIVLLADALDTTCDYILRGIQSENIDIYRATGLSDDAISFLQVADPPEIDYLNFLLTNTSTEDFFFYMGAVIAATEKLIPWDRTVRTIRQRWSRRVETDGSDETFAKWFAAKDEYDLALFRWTKSVMNMANEIKVLVDERGNTDEEP